MPHPGPYAQVNRGGRKRQSGRRRVQEYERSRKLDPQGRSPNPQRLTDSAPDPRQSIRRAHLLGLLRNSTVNFLSRSRMRVDLGFEPKRLGVALVAGLDEEHVFGSRLGNNERIGDGSRLGAVRRETPRWLLASLFGFPLGKARRQDLEDALGYFLSRTPLRSEQAVSSIETQRSMPITRRSRSLLRFGNDTSAVRTVLTRRQARERADDDLFDPCRPGTKASRRAGFGSLFHETRHAVEKRPGTNRS